MTSMREPRNLVAYSPADVAARDLEMIAADFRQHVDLHPLVRWTLQIAFWNPAWKSKAKPPKGARAAVGKKARR